MRSYSVFECYGDHRDLHLSLRRQRQMCIETAYGWLGAIHADEAYAAGYTGKGQKVGIFDTPVVLALIHISEPTRPLYISYAVFCLKKKKKKLAKKEEQIFQKLNTSYEALKNITR